MDLYDTTVLKKRARGSIILPTIWYTHIYGVQISLMALIAVKAAFSWAFPFNQARPTRTSAKRNRCINATPFIRWEKAWEINVTRVDQVLYAHFKVGVLSSESFLFQIIWPCLSNELDFTLISQTKYTLICRYGIADSRKKHDLFFFRIFYTSHL